MVGTTSVSKKNRVFERMRITKEQKVTIKETLEVFPKIVRYFMVRKEMSTTIRAFSSERYSSTIVLKGHHDKTSEKTSKRMKHVYYASSP